MSLEVLAKTPISANLLLRKLLVKLLEIIFLVNFPETPFLFVFFHEIIRIYFQRSIYNTIQTYFEKTNKL